VFCDDGVIVAEKSSQGNSRKFIKAMITLSWPKATMAYVKCHMRDGELGWAGQDQSLEPTVAFLKS